MNSVICNTFSTLWESRFILSITMSKNKGCLHNLHNWWEFSFHPWHPSGHQSFSRSGQSGWTSVPLQILYTSLLLWFLVGRSSDSLSRSTLTFSFLASILIAFSDQSSERASGFSVLLLLSIMLSSGNLLTRCFVAATEKIWLPGQTSFVFLLKTFQFLYGFVYQFPILCMPNGFQRLPSWFLRILWQACLLKVLSWWTFPSAFPGEW